MRGLLLDACHFDWSDISPAIFGALFQSVMDPKERRAQGAHYTTEKNILKVIEPLFMDDLRAEFTRLRSRKDSRRLVDLRRFQEKLGQLQFFDPACGCGNFLIIAYRELRMLEIELIREIRSAAGTEQQAGLDVALLSHVDVDQFYGIEIGEFPARIAATAMWMMDHIMNNRLSLEFGQTYARIPLRASPHIVHGDALEIDWADLLPPEECSFVFGNPPFGGFVMRSQAKQAQSKELMARLGASGSRLDYVAAWFLKAGAYFEGHRARIGFVAINSITQGEQVAQLWPALFERYGLEIAFAHRTFAWGSDARGVAHVHVVIIGLSDRSGVPDERRLFSYEKLDGDAQETRVAAISPHLVDAGQLSNHHLVVKRQRTAINGFPRVSVGTKPVDGGNYIFDAAGTRRVSGGGAGGRALASTVHRGTRISPGPRALDSGVARRSARCVGAAAARAGADGRRPRPARGQHERVDAQARGDANALPCQRAAHRAVSGHSRSQFRAAGIRPDRLAGAASDSKQQALCTVRRDACGLCLAHVRHAHGLAPPRRRTA